MANTAAVGISGRPSERAMVLCSCRAVRTAGIPPSNTCSAIGCCSGGSIVIRASRWARPGRSFLGLGRDVTSERDGRTGRSRRGPASAGAEGLAGPSRRGVEVSLRRGRRGGRSPAGDVPPPRPPLPLSPLGPLSLSVELTPGSSRPEPTISSRSGSRRSPLGGKIVVTVIPSMSTSASARTTSPTAQPGGRSLPSSTPLG